ncbi:hypothetical protein BDV96DRAFT_654394 [Lophiotrema nucula]|uniref:Uncharacterized protein n=1 Tax=Lophiotrema nucula TaxID=690887 RepID=A0A6A5YIF2_9PLEO|nr:hypothetical protein BDV96DRAFT_654394 [Lophiotrema nucula]
MASTPASLTTPTATPSIRPMRLAEWQNFMVNAAIALTGPDSRVPHSLEGWKEKPEDAKVAILTSLNALEFNSLYTWPDFQALGFNFENMMKLRRALVTDLADALLKSKEFQDALQKRHEPKFSTQLPTPQANRTVPAPVKHSRQTQTSPTQSRARSEIPESDSESTSGHEVDCLRCDTNPKAWDRIEKNSEAWEHLLFLFNVDDPLDWACREVDADARAEDISKAVKEKSLAEYKDTQEWKAFKKTVETHEHLFDLYNLEKLDDEVASGLDAEALAENIYEAITDKVLAEHKQPKSGKSSSSPSPEPETQMRDGDADDEASMRTNRTQPVRPSFLKRRFGSPPPSSQQGTRRRV